MEVMLDNEEYINDMQLGDWECDWECNSLGKIQMNMHEKTIQIPMYTTRYS